jgi:hypothetical protein
MKQEWLLAFDWGIWRVMVREHDQPAIESYSSTELSEVLSHVQQRTGGPVGIPLLTKLTD